MKLASVCGVTPHVCLLLVRGPSVQGQVEEVDVAALGADGQDAVEEHQLRSDKRKFVFI